MENSAGVISKLKVLHYPHPTLRHVSKPLKRVDAELRRIVREMFDAMYETKGIGLAANQVDLPYRLFVVNLACDPQAADQEYVFINPVLSRKKGSAEQEEGCLSLPGLYCQVKRPETVVLNAYDLSGQEFRAELQGLLARVAQHETDHLDGMLFIDHLPTTSQLAIKQTLLEMEHQFESQRRRGEVPDDDQILARLAELESLRT